MAPSSSTRPTADAAVNRARAARPQSDVRAAPEPSAARPRIRLARVAAWRKGRARRGSEPDRLLADFLLDDAPATTSCFRCISKVCIPYGCDALLHQLLQRRVALGPLDRLAHRAGRDEHLGGEDEPRRRPCCGRRRCAMMPWSASPMRSRISSAGLALRRERRACGRRCASTSGVWSVESTRWPVSAALSAMSIVSSSRISPTRITSGSWRSAARSASAKVVGVDADLALADARLVVVVEELDRVLDRDDVERLRAG